MNEPMPGDFGWRYIWWNTWLGLIFIIKWTWAQAITILMTIQAVLAAITLDPTLVPHDMLHWLLVANAVLCAVLAQIKRENPKLTKE